MSTTAEPASLALVDASGQVIYSEGGLLPIYSIAKTYTAAAVLLSDIDLDARIDRWIPATVLSDAAHISVSQLLQHTSGIRDYGGPESPYIKAVTQGKPPWSDAEFAEHTFKQQRLFNPGSAFAYSNPGYWLLKEILQKEHDASWEAVLRQLIFDPLQLTQTQVGHGQFADDLPDYPAQWVWPGVIVATAADTARFMASPLVKRLSKSLVTVPPHPLWRHPHYGYGLMVEPGNRYGHNGGGPGFTAACYHYLAEGLTACALLPRLQDEGGQLREVSEEQTMQTAQNLITLYRRNN